MRRIYFIIIFSVIAAVIGVGSVAFVDNVDFSQRYEPPRDPSGVTAQFVATCDVEGQSQTEAFYCAQADVYRVNFYNENQTLSSVEAYYSGDGEQLCSKRLVGDSKSCRQVLSDLIAPCSWYALCK